MEDSVCCIFASVCCVPSLIRCLVKVMEDQAGKNDLEIHNEEFEVGLK